MMTNATAATDALPEGATMTTKILCRYHLHGACTQGAECTFSHDRTLSPSMVCRYYQQGMCRYGDRCRYNHVKSHVTSGIHPLAETPGNLSPLHPHPKPTPALAGRSLNNVCTHAKPETAKTLSVTAAEFVPGQLYQGAGSYASAVRAGSDDVQGASAAPIAPNGNKGLLCPYAMRGSCQFGDECVYTHGIVCELCGLAVLHPTDAQQRAAHIEECEQVLEKDMEMSFLIAQSQEKECGICMEVVMEKEPVTERRFGILSNCKHVFCLECIRKWRKEKSFDSKAIRSCPECRTVSDFVTPSDYWVESREEKNMLIEGYKQAMKKKPCQYFKKGAGECPFNQHCFYEHAYPDGRPASPRPPRRHRHMDLIQQIILWDFFEERENQIVQNLGDLLRANFDLRDFSDSDLFDTDSDDD